MLDEDAIDRLEDDKCMAECFRLTFEQHPAFTNDDTTKHRLKLAQRIKDAANWEKPIRV